MGPRLPGCGSSSTPGTGPSPTSASTARCRRWMAWSCPTSDPSWRGRGRRCVVRSRRPSPARAPREALQVMAAAFGLEKYHAIARCIRRCSVPMMLRHPPGTEGGERVCRFDAGGACAAATGATWSSSAAGGATGGACAAAARTTWSSSVGRRRWHPVRGTGRFRGLRRGRPVSWRPGGGGREKGRALPPGTMIGPDRGHRTGRAGSGASSDCVICGEFPRTPSARSSGSTPSTRLGE